MSLTAGFHKCLTRWVGGISAVPGVSLDGFMSLAVVVFKVSHKVDWWHWCV